MVMISGVAFYQNIFTLFSVAGVLFELISLLFKKEILVRIFSLIGQPFWLIFNCACGAWGSGVGNVIAITSIVIALLRYHSGRAEHAHK
ncbi:MAG: YgjV family protein [Ruminococcaceae bacterium]|nr:YgjV family protein [Oscillospiraceae bacterium]